MLRAQLVRDALVGVEAEDPVVLCGLGGELLLRGEARPGALDDARAALVGDLARRVGRFGIDDQHLVGPRDRLARRADVLRLVEGDDGGGDLQDRMSAMTDEECSVLSQLNARSQINRAALIRL